MTYPLRSLLELMDEALGTLDTKYRSVKDFLSSDSKSQAFIETMLDENTRYFAGKVHDIYHLPQDRAPHVAITFLTGMVFSEFHGFYDALPSILGREGDPPRERRALAQRLWLITSLNHDDGYRHRDLLKNDTFDLQSHFPFFLFTDHYQTSRLASAANYSRRYPKVMAHSYDQILNYNDYIRHNYFRWNENSQERNDHGIIGGAYRFNDLVRKAKKLDQDALERELPLIKACCLSIAQHNLFISPDEEYDTYYSNHGLTHLLHDSSFRISSETPLLLFLCLIDTIECVKRFGKCVDPTHYLITTTILEKIKVFVSADRIILDFTELAEHIHQRDLHKPDKKFAMSKSFGKYLESLKAFHTWTTFHTEPDPTNDAVITITLPY